MDFATSHYHWHYHPCKHNLHKKTINFTIVHVYKFSIYSRPLYCHVKYLNWVIENLPKEGNNAKNEGNRPPLLGSLPEFIVRSRLQWLQKRKIPNFHNLIFIMSKMFLYKPCPSGTFPMCKFGRTPRWKLQLPRCLTQPIPMPLSQPPHFEWLVTSLVKLLNWV